jgi:hypothetical protein
MHVASCHLDRARSIHVIILTPLLPEGEGGKDNFVTFIEIRGVQYC